MECRHFLMVKENRRLRSENVQPRRPSASTPSPHQLQIHEASHVDFGSKTARTLRRYFKEALLTKSHSRRFQMPAGFPFKNKYPQIYIYTEKFRYIDIRTYGYNLLATAKVMRSGVLGGHSSTRVSRGCLSPWPEGTGGADP